MFDRIAHRYDLLNRVLSLRRDVYWRNAVANYLPEHRDLTILDVATGTADLLISLVNKCDRIKSAVGMDMSPRMLELGQKKISSGKYKEIIRLVRSDALWIPFTSSSFDAVTIAFGIRNVTDVSGALGEMSRVLKPGGKILILEFSLPRNRFLRKIYPFHLKGILPRMGSIISGDPYAYHYLNETVQTFPHGEQFCLLLEKAGFNSVKAVPLTGGIVTIYHACKAGADS